MKKQIFVNIKIAVFIILMLASFASAQEPKNVTDYLLAMPNDLFKLVDDGFENEDPAPKTKAEMDKYRQSKILVKDIKNGYIEYDHFEFPTQIALFKKKDGGYLMSVSVRSLVHADKGQVCSGELSFVEYNNGAWQNVTERYTPKLTVSEIKKAKRSESCYKLPQQGRKIRLYSLFWETEDTWGYFEWDGEKFIAKP